MSMEETIVRSRGGTLERIEFIADIDVPDLWHIAMAVKDGTPIPKEKREMLSNMILDTWHIAHDLKRHIEER